MVCMSAPRLYHRAAVGIEDAGFEIRDMWEWLYTQNQVKAMSVMRSMMKDQSLSDAEKEELSRELQTWKTPQVKSCFEPMVLGQKPREGTYYDNWKRYSVGLVNMETVEEDSGRLKVTSNVKTTEELSELLDKTFLVGKPSKSEKGDNTHLSVKPLALMRHVVDVLVPLGGVVLDPFSGSGSTGIGAIEKGSKYIGFENNEVYYGGSAARFSERWEIVEHEGSFSVM